MTSIGYALARAALIRTLTAYSGITTEDGEADGTTLVDSNLIDRNDFISEKTILIMSGDAKDEDKGASGFTSGDGTITLQGAGFSHQIKAGTIFRVLNISTVEMDVATIDGKIGTNTDPAGTSTLFAWMLKLFTQGGQGLVYYSKVTAIDDATHFRVAGLAGFGDAYFANTYRVYVVRDAAGGGAAPQGEMQPISDYVSDDGTFAHTAFTVPLTVDDEVLILHPRLAEVKDLIDRLGTAADVAGTTTLFARLRQIVDTYLADGTIGLAQLKAYVDTLEATLGAVDTAAATGAVSDAKMAMAYLKQLVTELIVVDGIVNDILEDTGTTIPEAMALASVLGALADAAAEGAVTESDTGMAYLKQLVTLLLNGTYGLDALQTLLAAITAAGPTKDEMDTAHALLATVAKQNRVLCSMDFWSVSQEEVALTGTAGDKPLPSVTIADLPDTATIVRAIAMFKFRMVENHTYAGANALNGAQEIQVKEHDAGSYVDAINFVTGQFALAQDTREGGDVIIGAINIAGSGKVEANGVYDFQWEAAWAEETGINFNDVACGIRVLYSI